MTIAEHLRSISSTAPVTDGEKILCKAIGRITDEARAAASSGSTRCTVVLWDDASPWYRRRPLNAATHEQRWDTVDKIKAWAKENGLRYSVDAWGMICVVKLHWGEAAPEPG